MKITETTSNDSMEIQMATFKVKLPGQSTAANQKVIDIVESFKNTGFHPAKMHELLRPLVPAEYDIFIISDVRIQGVYMHRVVKSTFNPFKDLDAKDFTPISPFDYETEAESMFDFEFDFDFDEQSDPEPELAKSPEVKAAIQIDYAVLPLSEFVKKSYDMSHADADFVMQKMDETYNVRTRNTPAYIEIAEQDIKRAANSIFAIDLLKAQKKITDNDVLQAYKELFHD